MQIGWSMGLRALPLAALVACGSAEQRTGSEAVAPVDAGEVVPISGMYQVEGATIDKATGERRDISGTVILATEGTSYTATFHLATTFPGTGVDPVTAEVIGRGEGSVEGRTLSGAAHTQLVVASIPGVDPNFAFIPRQVSTRLISDSSATITDDGVVTISIESRAEPGEDYSPTKTTLKGHRTASAPLEKRAARKAEAPPQ